MRKRNRKKAYLQQLAPKYSTYSKKTNNRKILQRGKKKDKNRNKSINKEIRRKKKYPKRNKNLNQIKHRLLFQTSNRLLMSKISMGIGPNTNTSIALPKTRSK